MPSFSEDVTSGNHLAALEAMRDQIAADITASDSMRDRAALYLRLSDVLSKIEESRPAEAKGDPVDEIAKRRAARRAGTG